MAPNRKKTTEAPQDLDQNNLGQVREILFGTQSREFEKRLSRLEAKLEKESAAIRADLKSRVDTVDRYVRQEVDSLTESIRAEQQERSQALKDAARELEKTAKAIDKKLTRLEDRLTRTERTLNQHLLDQVTALREDLAQRTADLESLMEREASELREAKVERADLSALLQEVALRLTDSFELPDVG